MFTVLKQIVDPTAFQQLKDSLKFIVRYLCSKCTCSHYENKLSFYAVLVKYNKQNCFIIHTLNFIKHYFS